MYLTISRRLAAGTLAALLALSVTGCGSKKPNVIEGVVTYDGAELEKGFITFFPVGDASATRGGEIVHGRYSVVGVPPGKKRALVVAAGQPVAYAAANGRQAVWLTPPVNPIAPTAEGNSREVDITPTSQTVDFHLRGAAGR